MTEKLIGRGNTADVFDIGGNKVIKLFKAGYPVDSVQKEFENSKLVNMFGLYIVKSHELVTHDGRYGIVYDKIDGRSLYDLILETYDFEKYSIALAVLHKKILSYKVKADSLKSILLRNIENTDLISLQCKSKLISVLEVLPEGDCFCHGDFHFGNIMASRENYYIIDYMNVCSGHEYGDIARTVYLTEMTPVPAGITDREQFLQIKKTITDIYLKEMGVSRDCLSDWLIIIAAARLSELSDEQNNEINSILDYLELCGI